MQGNLHARFLEGESSIGPTYLNPALIGGFGNKKIQITNFSTVSNSWNFNLNNFNINSVPGSELRLKLGSYLAGLIEADGSFAIHDKDSKAKKYLPKILIVFSLNDRPLAEKLISITKIGKLNNKQNQGCVI